VAGILRSPIGGQLAQTGTVLFCATTNPPQGVAQKRTVPECAQFTKRNSVIVWFLLSLHLQTINSMAKNLLNKDVTFSFSAYIIVEKVVNLQKN